MPTKRKQPSWKKYWKPARTQFSSARDKKGDSSHFGMKNFDSWLPEYYEGPTNRLVRYTQYDQMDLDHEVSGALDTISEFSTIESGVTGLPFEIETNGDDITKKEVEIIQKMLRQWCNLNEFNKRIFKIFRNSIKYGDQFFVRDPDSYKLFWVDPSTVEKIQVNEASGKEIEVYFIKDLDFNLKNLVATNVHSVGRDSGSSVISASKGLSASPTANIPSSNYVAGHGGAEEVDSTEVDATHVVHISLTEGMDAAWPFGVSILEKIYKIFKQKELLEDSILIYRVHRAPQRRVFNIHTGDMPNHRALEYLETIKNQVNQRRIPTRDGEGGSVIDAAYSPMSMLEDYYFAVDSEGNQSSVSTIDGDMDGLSNIDDLRYFNNKMLRALAVPSSYLPTGPEDGSQPYSDGRISAAFIQEFRFDRYCRRLQRAIVDYFDFEFKLYLKYRGVEFDSNDFNLKFSDPQNFSEYRQLEIDQLRISVFSSIQGVPFVSNQFALKRYLGWSDVEIQQNEEFWKKENGYRQKVDQSAADLVSTRDVKQMDTDIEMAQEDHEEDETEADFDAAELDMEDEMDDTTES